MSDERPRHRIEDICARLNVQAEEIARRIVPNGRLRGRQYWMLNPRRPDGGNWHTFSVNVSRGLWKDFSSTGGADGGDMFKFIAVFACGGDNKRAWRWALDFLGETGREPDPAETQRLAAKRIADDKAASDKIARKRRWCMHLWLEAKPLEKGDPASEYLRARGVDVHALPGGAPRALRFHPAIDLPTSRYYDGRDYVRRDGPFPAMLAHVALEGLPQGLATLHATALAPDGGTWRKAERAEPDLSAKEVFCGYSGGSIRLTRGKSGKPLPRADKGEWILLAEGIENALTGAIAEPEARAIASCSIANMANVALPAQIAGVTILADNDDAANAAAQKGLDRAQDALADRGLDVALARVPARFKDFNDALRGKELQPAQ